MSRSSVRAALSLLLLSAALGAGPARGAGQFEISTFLDPKEGLTDTRPFQFVIQIGGQQPPQRVRPADFPRVDGLQVTSGPNTNSRYFWANGQATTSYQISFQLLAEHPGRFSIPPVELEIDGQSYRTEPVTIEVAKGQDAPRGGRPGAREGDESEPGDAVFVDIQLGSDEVWVGQPVPLSVNLMSAVRVADGTIRAQPSFSKFWSEKIEDPQDGRFQKRIDGRVYDGIPVDRRILVPLSAGEFTIDPYVLQLDVAQSARDVFDIFSFGRRQSIVRKTPALKLRVKPLPAGKPAGFSGAVGHFQLSVSVDRERAAVNDAVALRATVEGDGFLQSVEAPQFDTPSGIKVLDTNVVESNRRVSGKLISRKTWEWILVPLSPGQVELPELSFPYFDPLAEKYEIARSEPIRLAVERGDRSVEPSAIRNEIQVQTRDLAYIKPLRGDLVHRHPRAQDRAIYRALLFVPLLLTPLIVVLGRRQARLRTDLGLSRARRAKAKARKGILSAKKGVQTLDSASFHEQVARTLVEYVADRFNRSPAGLTYELADELLASRSVDTEVRRRYRACLERCDFARFVPSSSQTERRTEVLEEASALIDLLERAW